MSNIINFNKILIQNIVKKIVGHSNYEFEIVASVTHYLNNSLNNKHTIPQDAMNSDTSVFQLFEGDTKTIQLAILKILDYWDIPDEEYDVLLKLYPIEELVLMNLCQFIDMHSRQELPF